MSLVGMNSTLPHLYKKNHAIFIFLDRIQTDYKHSPIEQAHIPTLSCRNLSFSDVTGAQSPKKKP